MKTLSKRALGWWLQRMFAWHGWTVLQRSTGRRIVDERASELQGIRMVLNLVDTMSSMRLVQHGMSDGCAGLRGSSFSSLLGCVACCCCCCCCCWAGRMAAQRRSGVRRTSERYIRCITRTVRTDYVRTYTTTYSTEYNITTRTVCH